MTHDDLATDLLATLLRAGPPPGDAALCDHAVGLLAERYVLSPFAAASLARLVVAITWTHLTELVGSADDPRRCFALTIDLANHLRIVLAGAEPRVYRTEGVEP